MNFYKHHIGDYDADTAHLSWLEDAAYRRLLSLYYRREAPIPLDVRDACRLVRATQKTERDAVAAVLREFFAEGHDGWHHKRCDAEIEAAHKIGEKNRENGKRGGRPQSGGGTQPPDEPKPNGNPLGSQTVSAATEFGNLSQTPLATSQTQEKSARHSDAPSRAPDDPPGEQPTPAGRMCRAIRQAGLAAVNPGDPRLGALIAQGATEQEFVGIATEAVAKGKGFAWLLATVQGRRADAAAVSLVPPPKPSDWRDTRSGVIQRACALGIGPFEEISPTGRAASFDAYKRRVLEADAAQEQHA